MPFTFKTMFGVLMIFAREWPVTAGSTRNPGPRLRRGRLDAGSSPG
jgi:hypothetical protein